MHVCGCPPIHIGTCTLKNWESNKSTNTHRINSRMTYVYNTSDKRTQRWHLAMLGYVYWCMCTYVHVYMYMQTHAWMCACKCMQTEKPYLTYVCVWIDHASSENKNTHFVFFDACVWVPSHMHLGTCTLKYAKSNECAITHMIHSMMMCVYNTSGERSTKMAIGIAWVSALMHIHVCACVHVHVGYVEYAHVKVCR